MILPTQYDTKNKALTVVRLVEPAMLAVINDMHMANEAV